MKIVKMFCFFGVLLSVLHGNPLRVEAAELKGEAVVEETVEEDGQRKIFRLSVKETYEGETEPAQTYDYNGRTYQLENAEIEYIYARRQTGETAEFTEFIELPEDDITLIPKEKTDGDMVYVLDESSLQLQITGYGSSEGTRLKEYSVEIPNLPDNDMARLEAEIEKDGINYVLTDVEYAVTANDDYGIPSEYKAMCHYEGAESYSISIPNRWQTPARYVGHVMEDYISATIITASYSYSEDKAEIESPEIPEVEEIDFPRSRQIHIGAIAAGTTGGVIVAVAGYLFFTAPVYAAMLNGGGYKYIGRTMLKKKKDHYKAKVSSSMYERAETNRYKIKLPSKALRRSDLNVLEIRCPDGNILYPKLGKEVTFTIQRGDE